MFNCIAFFVYYIAWFLSITDGFTLSEQHFFSPNISYANIDSLELDAKPETSYHTVQRGSQYADHYRLYFRDHCGSYVSPWHDIPLYVNQNNDVNNVVNMVVEIPRWTHAKMEINTRQLLNPIRQDVKNGRLRYVHNVFPFTGHICNYGALPQTWEDPNHVDPESDTTGDNDPLDICEIGQKIAKRGEVLQVKVLGALALIDKGETDWKVIAIDVNDPLADRLLDIDNVDVHFPGLLNATREWFRIYKTPTGSAPNHFGFGGEYRNQAEATQVVEQTHQFWRKLVENANTSNASGLETHFASSQYPDAVHHITQIESKAEVDSHPPLAPDALVPADNHRWHYIDARTHTVV